MYICIYIHTYTHTYIYIDVYPYLPTKCEVFSTSEAALHPCRMRRRAPRARLAPSGRPKVSRRRSSWSNCGKFSVDRWVKPWENHGKTMGKWRFHCGNLWMWKILNWKIWRMRMGMVFLDGIFLGFLRGEN